MALFSGLIRGFQNRAGGIDPDPASQASALQWIQAAQQAQQAQQARDRQPFGAPGFGQSPVDAPGQLDLGAPVFDDGGVRQSGFQPDAGQEAPGLPPGLVPGQDPLARSFPQPGPSALAAGGGFGDDGRTPDRSAGPGARAPSLGAGAEPLGFSPPGAEGSFQLDGGPGAYFHLASQARRPSPAGPALRPQPRGPRPAPRGPAPARAPAHPHPARPAIVAPIVDRPGYEDELKSRISGASDALSGYNYDDRFLTQAEDMRYQGYRPHKGKSGITIATGFDLGQQLPGYIRSLGLPPELTERLLPYAAFGPGRPRIRAAADAAFKAKPLAVTPLEAEAISKAVKADFLQRVEKLYDSRSRTPFRSLPNGMQTAILSFAYQHSPEFARRGKSYRQLWDQLTSQDWAGAIDSLAWFGTHENKDAYKGRRNGEIGQIRRELPPPPPSAGKLVPPRPVRR